MNRKRGKPQGFEVMRQACETCTRSEDGRSHPTEKEMPSHDEEPEATPSPPENNKTYSKTGRATWRCRNGHAIEVRLWFDGDACYRDSAWDFCNRCSEAPSDADVTRMSVEIPGMWLREGTIDRETRAALCHAAVNRYPHLDRDRLEELADQAERGELRREELTEQDRNLIMRAVIGLR